MTNEITAIFKIGGAKPIVVGGDVPVKGPLPTKRDRDAAKEREEREMMRPK